MSTAAQAPQQTTPGKPGAPGYEVSRPMGKCAISGNPIEPGTKFMAALRETPTGFERLDILLDAWPTFDQKDVLAYWQAVMPRPEQVKKKLFVDDQVLCELFERLASTTEQSKLNFRFVLGLILMRKRLIIYESTEMQDGKEIWKVKMKGRDDHLDLINPKLDEQQVTEVSQQLGEILNQEL